MWVAEKVPEAKYMLKAGKKPGVEEEPEPAGRARWARHRRFPTDCSRWAAVSRRCFAVLQGDLGASVDCAHDQLDAGVQG